MPLYDFKCPKCGKVEERLASSDAIVFVCNCGPVATRLPSKGSFIVRGYNAGNGYFKPEEDKIK